MIEIDNDVKLSELRILGNDKKSKNLAYKKFFDEIVFTGIYRDCRGPVLG